jgi:hypothetical protein
MPATECSNIHIYDTVGFLTDRIRTANTNAELEVLLRTDYRASIPYRMALCGLGEIKGGVIYELINIDTPEDYLSVVVNYQSNGAVLDCPAMREWSKKRETVFLQQPHLVEPTNKKWVTALSRYNIENVVIGGFADIARNHTSAFCFIGIPKHGRDSYLKIIDLTIASLHRTLVNIYQKNRNLETSANKLKITARELELLHFLYHGLSNQGNRAM